MFALLTDLYELTMMAGYYAAGMTGRATFDLYVRSLPPCRSYLVAAGLEQALAYLEELRFEPDEIDYLRGLPSLAGVDRRFFDERLARFRFTGDVWAVPEGTPVFAGEPIVRVTAPLPEAQLVETALLSILMFQTSIATKASRVVQAAAGRQVVEFGGRRAHGPEAAVHAARAAFLAGCDATSNVEAGHRFGIPLSGTMAHSWVMAHASEEEAFRRYSDLYPGRAVLLLDTYDTVSAARRIVASGLRPEAVRLDSGDIVPLSREVRAILDTGGLRETRLFVSGDLDEYRVAELVRAGACVDGFGVGTALSTSSDAPALSGVYKLAEVDRGGASVPTQKLSAGKRTLPGRKQVWRRVTRDGVAAGDVVGLETEPALDGAPPLLEPVMRAGRPVKPAESLEALRHRAIASVGLLPAPLRRLDGPADYAVDVSPALARLADRLARAPARPV